MSNSTEETKLKNMREMGALGVMRNGPAVLNLPAVHTGEAAESAAGPETVGRLRSCGITVHSQFESL